ncbi:helix-turn-helix domain-containing protein [Granulicella cerasi]|uniref:Helix-turn-helix domain-containing protein n=1 Tax=Granulicella cerasi TaxID=741063 RepID=A0ABW1ZB72_9BACT|nr:helix-turn-helix domain-containing protein [Granulicella cerasi]
MQEFGASLRAERERLGVPIDAVCEGTKVSLRYLQALEQGAFPELPGGVFNRGIVQSYCRYLGLDEDVWMERYVAAQPSVDETDFTQFAEAVKRNRLPSEPLVRNRWWGVLAMLLAFLAIAFAIWHYVIHPRPGHGTAAPDANAALAGAVSILKA